MTASNASSRAPLYDLFKLIVAILLLLIFLFLLIWMRPVQTRQPESISDVSTPIQQNTQPIPATQSPLTTLSASPTVASASSTSVPLTETPAPTITPTPVPTETPLLTASLTPTIIPLPTESPVPEVLPTPIIEIPAETSVCETVSRSQLQVGMQAIIQRRLNFRSSPGIKYNWLLTNIPGTRVEIIGGPECTRYEGGGAYLWWNIRLPNGREGWSAEASAYGTFYFMEPMP